MATSAGFRGIDHPGRRVLSILGINIDAPPGQYALGYALILPVAAERGYYRWLRDEARAAGVRRLDCEQELRLLAREIRLPGPDERLPALAEALRRASCRLGRTPAGLREPARYRLVTTLAREPTYARLLEDAIVDAAAGSSSR